MCVCVCVCVIVSVCLWVSVSVCGGCVCVCGRGVSQLLEELELFYFYGKFTRVYKDFDGFRLEIPLIIVGLKIPFKHLTMPMSIIAFSFL